MAFKGFGKDFFSFFKELEDNNDRDWFAANKHRYEDDVAATCLDFIAAIGEPLSEISPHFTAIPKKVGGSMFRIYRDTRFSKDKTPYKTNAGLHFRHSLGKNAHAPGFYLHLATNEIFMGAGIWMADSSSLAKIRARIDERPKDWSAVVTDKALLKSYGGLAEGNPLKRPPKGYDADHPYIDDLKKRSYFAIAKAAHKDAAKPGFVKQVADTFADAKPLSEFLCKALDAPF